MQAGGRLGLCWDAMLSATHSEGHRREVGQDQTQIPTLPGPVLPSSPTWSQAHWDSGHPWVITELRGATPQ